MQAIAIGILGLPMIEGKYARGSSSSANPALHIPEPLSITTVMAD